MKLIKTALMVIGAVAIMRATLRTIDAHYQKQMVDTFIQEAASVSLDMMDAFKIAHAEWHEDDDK